MEVFDTANPGSATWGLTDTAIELRRRSDQCGTDRQLPRSHSPLGPGRGQRLQFDTTATDVTLDGGAGPDSLLATAAPADRSYSTAGAGRIGCRQSRAERADHLPRRRRHRPCRAGRVATAPAPGASPWTPPASVPGVLEADGRIGTPGYTTGIVYDAEQVELKGGSGADVYYVTATAAAHRMLQIGTGAGQDMIQIGAAGVPVSRSMARSMCGRPWPRTTSGSTPAAPREHAHRPRHQHVGDRPGPGAGDPAEPAESVRAVPRRRGREPRDQLAAATESTRWCRSTWEPATTR